MCAVTDFITAENTILEHSVLGGSLGFRRDEDINISFLRTNPGPGRRPSLSREEADIYAVPPPWLT
eukprot:6189089-Pleurochrysis_carterae.AAC.3